MKRPRKRLSRKVGLPPGSLVHVGEARTEPAELTVLYYEAEKFEEHVLDDPDDCRMFMNAPGTAWINVVGIHNVDVVERVGRAFQLHPLMLEDILNTGQRPKMDEFEGYLSVILKVIVYDESKLELTTEQATIVLGDRYVITFLEKANGLFQAIRDNLRQGKGNLRKMGADYLAFVLLDVIVDRYFVALEHLGEDIEAIEEKLVTNPRPEELKDIHQLKKNMLGLRRSVWPLREVVGTLERGHSSLIRQDTRIYFRDVYDHTIQVIDTCETYREIVSGMLDIYLSGISNRLNEIMKVLTIISTIFIPLTFLTGVYGMNFKYMPVLEWRHGYDLAWIVIIVIVVGQLAFFRHKKWI